MAEEMSLMLYQGITGQMPPAGDSAQVKSNKSTIGSISILLAQQNKDCFNMKLSEKLDPELRCFIK